MVTARVAMLSRPSKVSYYVRLLMDHPVYAASDRKDGVETTEYYKRSLRYEQRPLMYHPENGQQRAALIT